ncbi:hypothetical protein WUBG_05849 [Wuchereria bancrofti]|uniref:Dihydroorotate dehydrogenase (quinone), mitochondrial n=1 Tax=Wuchereria bancrofti TaxID=6293 RepID=J9F7A4_WUCBA|nr:hypothetical protein WUBG_05849 [Wuchereria bancrofti]
MPLLNCILKPELTARFNIYLAKYRLLPPFSHSYREHSELNCNVMNMHFRNPLGLAAGFDKDAEAIKGLRESGFGFIEVGTVTPLPQEDARDSVVKLLFKDEGYISRGKLKSAGLNIVYLFVKRAYDRNADVPLGVNIGRNTGFSELKEDYSVCAYYFGRFSNYLVVNLGSQNGPETITDMEIIVLNKRYNVDGIIISNSTTNHPKNLQSVLLEDGFLSGRPLRDISTDCIRNVYSLSHGKIPIIGCGGISTGQDAYEKIRAGASLVQLYSSLLYQGFPVVGRIKRELVECLARDGFRSISEAVGADHRK